MKISKIEKECKNAQNEVVIASSIINRLKAVKMQLKVKETTNEVKNYKLILRNEFKVDRK